MMANLAVNILQLQDRFGNDRPMAAQTNTEVVKESDKDKNDRGNGLVR